MKKTIIALLFTLTFSLNAYANDFDTAVDLQTQGKYDEAIQYYNKSLKVNPRNVTALNNLASLYQYSGKVDDAMQILYKAIEIDRKNYMSHYLLGDIYLTKGDLKNTLIEFKKVVQFNPNYPFVYQPISNIYYQIGNFDDAISSVKKALELLPDGDPQKEILHRNLSKVYHITGKPADAIAEVDLIKRLFPNSKFDYNKLKNSYSQAPLTNSEEMYFRKNYLLLPDSEKHVSVNDKNYILKWSAYSQNSTMLEFYLDNENIDSWTSMVTITSSPKNASLKEYIDAYMQQSKDKQLMTPEVIIEDSGDIFAAILLGDTSAKKVEYINLRVVQFTETNKQVYMISRAIPYNEFNKDPDKFKAILKTESKKLKSNFSNLNFKLFP